MDSAPRGGGGGRRGGRYGDHGGADYGRGGGRRGGRGDYGRGGGGGDYGRGGGGGYGRGGGGDYGRGGGGDYGRGGGGDYARGGGGGYGRSSGADYVRAGVGGGRGGEYTRGGRGGGDYGGVGRGGEYFRGGGRGGGGGGERGLGRQMDMLSLNESAEIRAAKSLFKKATPLPSKDDLKALKPPKRPGFGTIGKKVMVRANHFMVRVAETLVIYHYDVSVDMVGATRPVALSTSVNRAVLGTFVQQYGESHLDNRLIAYDGRKNIYSAGPLPAADGKSFVVKRTSDKDGRENEYTVTIRLAAKLDLKALNRFLRREPSECPQDVIQALDVVLRTKPSQEHLSFSRSFFFTHESHHAGLGNGVECWKGYYQSLRPTQMGLSLNIDQSATSFLEPKMVLDFLRDYLNLRDFSRQLSSTDSVKIKKILKNVKVETTHAPGVIVYRIRGLAPLSANQLKFTAHGGIELSVAQYFQEKYKISLTYPSLPCLIAGSDKKPTYLPMEVCKIIPGQRYSKKLNENQVRNMLYLTCSNPSVRANTIADMATDNHYEQDPFAKEFGIIVRNELKMVEGRLLPPPMLRYGGSSRNAILRPSNGAWNMRGQRMEIGAKVEYWAFVNLSSRIYAEEADRLCSGLISMCHEIGMQFSDSPLVTNYNPRSGESVDAALHKIKLQSDESLARLGKSNQNLQLLIIILPEESFYYGFIKRVCETELGVVSQCIHTRNVHRANPQYCANVALKINVKVGGRNNVVNEYQDADITKSPPPRLLNPGELPVSIIFGADVTHPQPGEDSSPSLAAVVASMDWPGMSRYRSAVSSQAHRQEIISDLYTSCVDASGKLIHGGLVRELLRSFYSLNAHRKPDRIIFFRDGVSEGQFADVLLYEMHAIRKACKSLEDTYSPFVTFIVVQKRHHTRLFPLPQEREMIDKSGNILPGTVVEKEICHPTEFDFYLCSHAGLKGTSRPTHYHVLYDENRFTADELQLLTYRLCYTFARCTRSVSVVPAAYYAHLAAFRARHYLDGDASDGGSTVAGTADSGGEVLVRDLPKIKDNVKEVMFFC